MNAVETSLDPVFLVATALVGLLLVAGFIGTYLNVASAKGPREHRYVRRACLGLWAIIALLLGVLYWVPEPGKFIVAGACILVFPIYVYRMSTMRQLIKKVDQQQHEESSEEAPP